MALLGLLVTARETGAAVALPDICNMDLLNKNFDPIPFGAVFDATRITNCLSHLGMQVADDEISDLPYGYDHYFWKMHEIFENDLFTGKSAQLDGLVIDVLKNLVARLSDSYLFRKLKQDVFDIRGASVAVQMRTETDWQSHCSENLNPVLQMPEDILLPYDRILEKTLNTLPGTKVIYVICDEVATPVPKVTMRDVCKSRFGVRLLWKSDFLTEFELARLTALELSLIDFEMALHAPSFVGLTRSTFSNMAALQKRSILGEPIVGHYVYNVIGDQLGCRTDDGRHWDPIKACAAGVVASDDNEVPQ